MWELGNALKASPIRVLSQEDALIPGAQSVKNTMKLRDIMLLIAVVILIACKILRGLLATVAKLNHN